MRRNIRTFVGDNAGTDAGMYSQATQLSASTSAPEVTVDTFTVTSSETELAPSDDSTKELLFIENGVQIYYLKTSEEKSPVQKTSSTLRVLHLTAPENNESSDDSALVLQINNLNTLLLPNTSLTMDAENGAYVFPNFDEENQDTFIGIVFDPEVPKEAREAFEKIITLTGACIIRSVLESSSTSTTSDAATTDDDQCPRPSRSQAASNRLLKSGEEFAAKITVLSEKIQKLLRERSDRLQDSITLTNREGVRIHWTLLKSLEGAGWMSGKVRVGTDKLARLIGRVTLNLAKQLCSDIECVANFIIPAWLKNRKPKPEPTAFSGLNKVADSGLEAALTVFVALEKAARNLAHCLAEEAVNVVDVKYGENAAQAVRSTAVILGNTAMTVTHHVAHGPKAIARELVTETGKLLVTNLKSKKPETTAADLKHSSTGTAQ